MACHKYGCNVWKSYFQKYSNQSFWLIDTADENSQLVLQKWQKSLGDLQVSISDKRNSYYKEIESMTVRQCYD
jgi:hypothetical protein